MQRPATGNSDAGAEILHFLLRDRLMLPPCYTPMRENPESQDGPDVGDRSDVVQLQ
jgi:hypothetical protein